MEEPPNLMLQARELLATPNHELLESLVIHLSTRQETTEYQTALPLFIFCTHNSANCLTLKLLQMYRSSSNGVLRSKSIILLSKTLAAYKSRRMQETETKLFRRIVSFIAHDVVMLDNGGLDELSDFIVELSSTEEPVKALHVFVDLPPVYGRFIHSCFRMIVEIEEIAEKVLLTPDQDRVEDWSLGLQAVVKLGIQVLDSEMRFDMVKGLLALLVKAASDLVEKGMEEFLVRGLADLEMFLSQDKKHGTVYATILHLTARQSLREQFISSSGLAIWLEHDFVVPILEQLLPEIDKRLNPPREVLVDNSCWVLAFLGAFCAINHLIEMESYAGFVMEMEDNMVNSVRELVEREMEVGLVRRAFRDVESIVKKQMEWFGKNEYKLIKPLLQRLYLIKGMTMESKMVLWRTNVFVDRGMADLDEQQPDGEID
ncbi:hypothetical protein YC2023_014626 [Brassica napus]